MNTLTPESLSFWPHLTRQQQETLLSCVQRASYAPGQIIRSPDTDCLGALLIQSGVVRIYLLSEDGREATISRMTEGEVCVLSASCMLNAITFDVQIQAETAVEVLVIPIQYLSVLMRENIYVENFIYKAAAQRFSHAIRAVEQMLFYTLEQRVASYLLEVPAAGDRYHSSYPGAAGPGHRQCPGGGDPYLKKTVRCGDGGAVSGRCAYPGPEGAGTAGRAGRLVKSQKEM